MEHIAIMKKSWKLIDKILSGEKKIESRWYINKSLPWGKVKAGEIIYFKDFGEPVTIKSEVERVLQFDDLNPEKVRELLENYAEDDGIGDKKQEFFQLFKNKKYCMLIFLKNPQKIKPFRINKKGFGSQAAWICISDVNQIKL